MDIIVVKYILWKTSKNRFLRAKSYRTSLPTLYDIYWRLLNKGISLFISPPDFCMKHIWLNVWMDITKNNMHKKPIFFVREFDFKIWLTFFDKPCWIFRSLNLEDSKEGPVSYSILWKHLSVIPFWGNIKTWL